MEQLTEGLDNELLSVQPDYMMELSAVTETDQTEKAAAGTGSIEVSADFKRAWNTGKGEDTVIAVIDTGIDVSHSALAGHITEGYDFCNDRTEVYDAEKPLEHVHGTHVAGIIAAAAPEAKIMPLKVFEDGKAYTSNIIRAISYA